MNFDFGSYGQAGKQNVNKIVALTLNSWIDNMQIINSIQADMYTSENWKWFHKDGEHNTVHFHFTVIVKCRGSVFYNLFSTWRLEIHLFHNNTIQC